MNEARKVLKKKMEDFDYVVWVMENAPVMVRLDEGDVTHVVSCLKSLVNLLTGEIPIAGSFITALSKGDFKEALAHADHVNEVMIKLYLVFIVTYVPTGLIKKGES